MAIHLLVPARGVVRIVPTKISFLPPDLTQGSYCFNIFTLKAYLGALFPVWKMGSSYSEKGFILTTALSRHLLF